MHANMHYVFTYQILAPFCSHNFPFLIQSSRTSLIGCDLNRAWTSPSELMHPEIYAIKADLIEMIRKGHEIDTVIDIHTSIYCVGSFLSGIKFDDVYRMEKHVLFPKLLARIADDFYPENCIYSSEPLRTGTLRRWVNLRKNFDLCNVFR